MTTELRTTTMPLDEGGDFAIQPYAFFDLAKVWNEAPELDDDLYSVGAGARTFFGGNYALDALVVVPLKRAGLQTQRGDVRVLFTLSASF